MEKLQALKDFFESDMKIKEILIKLAPSELNDVDESSRIEYIDELYKSLGSLEVEFLSSIKKFEFPIEVEEAIKEHFKKEREKFLIGKYEQGISQKMYASQFSNMEKKLIEEVKKNFKCCLTKIDDLVKLIQEAGTINELLHVIHSYIVNNEEILRSMPIVEQKQNTIGEPITLYGEKNNVAKKIYNEFPLEMDCGVTDIISLKDKVLMMVRDRGHALTIDIDTSKQDEIEVKYFIPKLCNRRKIEKLPGINKSGITESGASGFFVSKENEISEKLYEFIEKVPTDADIEITRTNIYKGKLQIIRKETQKQETQVSMQEVNNLAVNLWMNRFKGWYGAIDKVSQNVKSKLLKIKSDIVKVISSKIRGKNNIQKHQEER